jgi:hypothetical protein
VIRPPDIDALSVEELKALVISLLERVSGLTRTVEALREENRRLKGLKGKPDIKPPSRPSGMDQASSDKPIGPRRGGGDKTAKLVIHEERVLKVTAPPGSRFKGYEDFVVQDLVLRAYVVRYRRERWVTPEGRSVIAALPDSVASHFGAELRRFVLAQYHQGQVTVPRLVQLLRGIGIAISKRQIVRLLIGGTDSFLAEARGVLRAGLETATWISVDDTGARHQGTNAYCTQIGNHHFTWFGTRESKSRLNFLDLLRAGYRDYVLNDGAFAYMRERSLSDRVIAQLTRAGIVHFADEAAWNAHLTGLGITQLKVHPDPVMVATEGALWGSICAHGHLTDAVVLSDDAGQFAIGKHALCWVHAERLVHKLEAFTDKDRAVQESLRSLIWDYYRDLKLFSSRPSPQRRAELLQRFDRIFTQHTGWTTLDRLLKRLNANKTELLVALDRPEVPLNTNGSENDIRCHVTKRKVSGGTRSDQGRDCRDAFLGLAKTCAKLNIAFWDYLGQRLGLATQVAVPDLPNLIKQRCQTA